MTGWTSAALAAATASGGRDALSWTTDIIGAIASLVVIAGGIAGTRYLRRANLKLADCQLTRTSDGGSILRVSAQIENKGFSRLSFGGFEGEDRPSIIVAETVQLTDPGGANRRLVELQYWRAYDLDSDLVDPGELTSWTEVFPLPPPSALTVGYRVTCRVPVPITTMDRLKWRLKRLDHRLGLAPEPDPLESWWEDVTFLSSATAANKPAVP